MANDIPSVSPAAWTEANDAYLGAELARLRLLFRREVRRLRQTWRADPLAGQRSLVISDAHADRLLAGNDAETAFQPEDAEAADAGELHTIARALEEIDIDLAARRRALTPEGGIPALEALVRAFGLGPVERDALLLCFAADHDPGFATLCAYVQDDAGARHATLQVLLGLLCQDGRQRAAARMALLRSAPLRRFRLLEAADTGAGRCARPLVIDERIADYIRGINRLDDDVAQLLRPVQAAPLAGTHRSLVERLLRWAESSAGEQWTPVHLTGPAGAGKKAIAGECCARFGLQLYSIDPARLPLQDAERSAALDVLAREAVLSGLALYLDLTELDPAERQQADAARDCIERYGGVLFVGGRERWRTRRRMLHLAVPRLDAAAQARLWAGALQSAGQPAAQCAQGRLDALVQQFDLGPGAIRQAVDQNNRISEEAGPAFMLVLANRLESLLFHGNQCVMVERRGPIPGIYLDAARANVNGNVVHVPGPEEAAMYVAGSDLVVNANSVRTGALRVQGGAGAPPSRAIVTSNLCSAISAGAPILVLSNNLP